MQTISQIVAAHLAGQFVGYLKDIAAHGIHNVTQEFSNFSEKDREILAAEFKIQATAMLAMHEQNAAAGDTPN